MNVYISARCLGEKIAKDLVSTDDLHREMTNYCRRWLTRMSRSNRLGGRLQIYSSAYDTSLSEGHHRQQELRRWSASGGSTGLMGQGGGWQYWCASPFIPGEGNM